MAAAAAATVKAYRTLCASHSETNKHGCQKKTADKISQEAQQASGVALPTASRDMAREIEDETEEAVALSGKTTTAMVVAVEAADAAATASAATTDAAPV